MTSYKEFIKSNRNIIDRFCEVAIRKVSFIDEYGDESWETLETEKQRCLIKIVRKIGISEKFLINLFLEIEKREASGLAIKSLASILGQQLRFSISQIDKEKTYWSYFLVKLYFFDLKNIFKNYYGKHKSKPKEKKHYDGMDGRDFEVIIQGQLVQKGFDVVGTPKTGDQGADLIAVKDGIRYSIQAKRYKGAVSNSAVQEIVAAKNYYQTDIAVVVTNSKFTPSAKALAQKNNVLLVEGDQIPTLSELLYKFEKKLVV